MSAFSTSQQLCLSAINCFGTVIIFLFCQTIILRNVLTSRGGVFIQFVIYVRGQPVLMCAVPSRVWIRVESDPTRLDCHQFPFGPLFYCEDLFLWVKENYSWVVFIESHDRPTSERAISSVSFSMPFLLISFAGWGSVVWKHAKLSQRLNLATETHSWYPSENIWHVEDMKKGVVAMCDSSGFWSNW